MEPGGTLGNGRYVVRGVLGEGAQGMTFDAADEQGRPVAIKRFDVRGAKGWKDVELAERETRVLSTIDHPLVPRYIEHFEEDGALFLVMEKVEGETLEAIRKREGALSEDEVRRFLADADRALTYLHGRASPIVHRDIKPRNVVRRPNGSYVLVDFGAVSELLQRRGGNSTVVGTMGFMAPEQFQGRAMPATDVYAVGATALACLAGADPDTLPHQGLKVDVRAALGSRVSPTMLTSLEQMLEPDPDRRAQNLGAAIDQVRTSISHQPAPIHRVERVPSAPPPPMPHPAAIYYPPQRDPREDDLVKSLRRLLWVLWGLGWIIVPVMLSQLRLQRSVPIVMFGGLALVFILTWHKGAAIRALLRKMGWSPAAQAAPPPAMLQHPSVPPVHHRVDAGPPAQVRVHTTELQPDELGKTERTSTRTSVAAGQRASRS
ncbi:MAG: serine/threonine protein kinase [Labilithrix sp.]|nr:serine/threonine protein kinase [Labilithrix sp.]MCW5813249.1 serine/threonine protein kinase [Labilithrix sp.]